MYVKSLEKNSENFSQNNAALSINTNKENNVFCILEIIKKHPIEKPKLELSRLVFLSGIGMHPPVRATNFCKISYAICKELGR